MGISRVWCSLHDKRLVQISRLTQLERDSARLNGERAQYIAARAQAKGKITETELQIIQVDKDMVSEVSKDLRETNDKIGELIERKVAAEDQLRRVDIRAPQDGMVLQSNVHTVGGVVTAGDALMPRLGENLAQSLHDCLNRRKFTRFVRQD